MKKMRLYFQLFVSFCGKHPLAVAMYALTMVMGLFSVIFLYNSQINIVQRNRGDITERVLTFSVTQPSPDLWDYLENNEDIEDRTLMTRDTSLLPEEIRRFEPPITDIGTDYLLVLKPQFEQINFSATDALEILLPTDIYGYLLDKQKLDEPFYIGDIAYRVVGYHDQHSTIMIPYETFKQHFPVQSISLLVKEDSLHQVEAIQNDLMQKFGLSSKRYLENIEQDRTEGLLSVVALGIAAVFGNILFLVTYLFNLRDREFAIYRLLGLSKIGLWLYMMLESTLIYLLNYGISYGLHWLYVHFRGGRLDNSTLMFTLLLPLGVFLLLVSALFVFSLHRDRDREVYV